MTRNAEWFATWFDSPYYPLLYNYRDEEEAARFVDQLMQTLALPAGQRVLDVGCGSGRHVHQLARMGYRATGIDLSPASIERARRDAPAGAHFQVADMRDFSLGERFDLVLNLFTSFGYFQSQAENLRVLERFHAHLQPGGQLVIDFLNAERVRSGLEPEQVQQRGAVRFAVQKRIEADCVVKNIEVEDNGERYHFRECVQLLEEADFDRLLQEAGFRRTALWGDYQGRPFDAATSPRLILFAQKEQGS